MIRKHDIQTMIDDGDTDGLVAVLRLPDAPSVRAAAANALAKMDATDQAESLARSHLEDPSPIVRQASGEALDALFGNQASAVIASYAGAQADGQPWVEEDEEISRMELHENSAPPRHVPDNLQPITWDGRHIEALVSIVRGSGDLPLRLDAVRQLGQIREVTAVNALVSIALWSDEYRLRNAAIDSLKDIYGDGYREVLKAFQDENPAPESRLLWDGDEPVEVFDGEDEEDAVQSEDDAAPVEDFPHHWIHSSPYQPPAAPPALEEERPDVMKYLVIGAILVMLGLLAKVYGLF